MKKIYFNNFKKGFFFFMTLLATGFSAHAQFPAPYCNVTFTSGVEPITSVQFAGITNTSPAAIGGTALENFTAMTGTVLAGSSYPITLKGNADGTTFINYYRVYIDWNQNNLFTDAGESYDIGTITGSTGVDALFVTSNIAVPSTALAGNTRMRVMKRFNAYPTGPCQTGTGYGQAEDYTLTVVAGADCTGTPTVGAATASVTGACASVAFTLTAAITPTPGLSYQWQSSTDAGTTWVNLGAAQTSVNYSVASQSVATSYRVVVTCTASTLSATSAAVAVAQNPYTNCYCTSAFNMNCTDGDVITNVLFGTLDNTSACGNATTGYTSYLTTVTPPVVRLGDVVDASVTVGPSADGWLYESVGIWIDFNHNGVFDASEYTYVGTGLDEAISATVTIPATALTGQTRMRVVLAASTAAGFSTAYSCGSLAANNNYGEMEDYLIDIQPALATPGFNSSNFAMYPNPTTGLVNIKFGNPTAVNAINVYSISGQLVFSKQFTTSSDNYSIDLQKASTGVYIVKIETENGTQVNRLIKN